MQRPSHQIAGPSPFGRSRVTNGQLGAGIDRRSANARQFKDLVRGNEAEFEAASGLDRGLIRTTATLALKVEEMEAAQLRASGCPPFEVTPAKRLRQKDEKSS
jgi:hypothetical protein